MNRSILLVSAAVMLVGCGLNGTPHSEDPRCVAEPPDWYWTTGDIPGLEGMVYYDNEDGACVRHRAELDCAMVCNWDDDLSDKHCRKCNEELKDWYPFRTILECHRVCIYGASE